MHEGRSLHEIDKTYYEKQEQRFKKETAQIQLF